MGRLVTGLHPIGMNRVHGIEVRVAGKEGRDEQQPGLVRSPLRKMSSILASSSRVCTSTSPLQLSRT